MAVVQTLSRLARSSAAGVREFARAGVDFVYPPVCCNCSAELVDESAGGSSGSRLCDMCLAALASLIERPCLRCGAPSGPHTDTTAGCIHCRRDHFAFETVVCLGVYQNELRRACLRAKHPGGGPLAAALGRLLHRQRQADLVRLRCDLIVAVPHHWTERWRHPHQASEILARTLADTLRSDYGGPILSKVRRTPAQASLPASRRRTNLRGAFRARRRKDLSGAAVLLVDDVLTTGATSQEAAKSLLRAGAHRVAVAVAARALIHHGHQNTPQQRPAPA